MIASVLQGLALAVGAGAVAWGVGYVATRPLTAHPPARHRHPRRPK